MVTTFGGIKLDKDEKSFLAFGPDYALYDDLKMEELEKEMPITAIKIIWARMNKEPDEIVNMRNVEEIVEEEEVKEIVYMC